MTTFDDDNDVPELTQKQMVKLLLDDSANNRRELQEQISDLDHKLSGRMNSLDGGLQKLTSEVRGLKLQVHRNHTTFIQNHEDLDRRVTLLETAA